jgi:hypothetical protein
MDNLHRFDNHLNAFHGRIDERRRELEDLRTKMTINYVSRDFESTLSDLITNTAVMTKLWRPEAGDDPGYVLYHQIASVNNVAAKALDEMAGECFLDSVKQRKNIARILAQHNYYLSQYTAAKTEITFTLPPPILPNTAEGALSPVEVVTSLRNLARRDFPEEFVAKAVLDCGYNGQDFATVTAETDVNGDPRQIIYNIIPFSSSMGRTDSRRYRDFAINPRQALSTEPFEVVVEFPKNDDGTYDCSRHAQSAAVLGIEGTLRSFAVSVNEVINNGYTIPLPSQHIDKSCIWLSDDSNVFTQNWVQLQSTAEFIEPQPRFAITTDIYDNAQVEVSPYLGAMDNLRHNRLIVHWIDTTGALGSVGENMLGNLTLARINDTDDTNIESMINRRDHTLSGQTAAEYVGTLNLPNTIEIPHTWTFTGKSPETANEARENSRLYINTWYSLSTVHDFLRFFLSVPGINTGVILDAQKALEINKAVYEHPLIPDDKKDGQYITNRDFTRSNYVIDWESALGYDPEDPNNLLFNANFKTHTAMCFGIWNDFDLTQVTTDTDLHSDIQTTGGQFHRYKPSNKVQEFIRADYDALQVMGTTINFGYVRVFNWFCVGTIYTHRPVSKQNAELLINKIKQAISIAYAPGNARMSEKPKLLDLTETILEADENIRFYDPGTVGHPAIEYDEGMNIDFFNFISFARYIGEPTNPVRMGRFADGSPWRSLVVAPECINDFRN